MHEKELPYQPYRRLVYDEEPDPFRFRGGKFAFSRTPGNWALLKNGDRMKGF